MKNVGIVLICLIVGFLGGAVVAFQIRPPTYYGVVEEDINLEHLGIQNQPAYGILKKGSVVRTGNVLKGGRASFEISGWVDKRHVHFVGKHDDLLSYLSKSGERDQKTQMNKST